MFPAPIDQLLHARNTEGDVFAHNAGKVERVQGELCARLSDRRGGKNADHGARGDGHPFEGVLHGIRELVHVCPGEPLQILRSKIPGHTRPQKERPSAGLGFDVVEVVEETTDALHNGLGGHQGGRPVFPARTGLQQEKRGIDREVGGGVQLKLVGRNLHLEALSDKAPDLLPLAREVRPLQVALRSAQEGHAHLPQP